MTAILALIPTLIPLISQGVTGVEHLIAWIETIRTAAQQSSEWTPDLEAAFVASLIALGKSRQWQTDAQLAASSAPVPSAP